MGWMTPWIIGELTPYPNGMSRAQIEAAASPAAAASAGGGAGGEGGGIGASAEPSDAWVETLSREWRVTFLLGGICNLAGAAVYLALASDRVQPWARQHAAGGSSSSSSSSTPSGG